MLEINHVSVKFKSSNNVLAVDDMTLSLPDGSKTALVGETGSGKSVLLLAILKLLPPNAEIRGNVLLDGEEMWQSTPKRMRQIRGGIISYVPQGGGASMNPLLKVGYQVGEPLMIHRNISKKDAVIKAETLLKQFNLGEEGKLLKAFPHMLSGGMRQRAMVAMGIAADAKIILADEPTKGLDGRRVELVKDTLKRLEGKTLLCVTHDMLFAADVAENICVMYAAQQMEYGTVEQITKHPLHPYTRDMIDAIPENGMKYRGNGFAPSHENYSDQEQGCRYRERCSECMEQCKKCPPLFVAEGHFVRCWKYAV